MKKVVITIVSLSIIILGCGGAKVTRFEETRITSIAWAGDTLVAFSKNTIRGFIAGGVKRNPKRSIELWLATVDPERGTVDTSYQIREIPEQLGRIEFFPGGDILLYAAENGVWKVDLKNGEREEFFTHPAIKDFPLEIDVGPDELYTCIVVDAEGLPGTEGLLDLFMVETETGILMFHSDSLVDQKSFAWTSEDCIVYISPDPWRPGERKIMQFGVTDCIIRPSDMTEEEVRCNCPRASISGSGLWLARDEGGELVVDYYKE